MWDEAEAEGKSSKGRGTGQADNVFGKAPKQHDKKCKKTKTNPKQQQNKRGIQSHPRTTQLSLISVTARAQVQALWNN